MPKLNQLLAAHDGRKKGAAESLTAAYHAIQRSGLFAGISRTYRKRYEDGEDLPAESTLVQANVGDIVTSVIAELVRYYDVVASRDATNAVATADIVVGGQVVAAAVPATTLLFLEKQLVDLRTFVSKLPTLDPAEQWSESDAENVFRSDVVTTHRTKKIPRNHVKAEATDRHPAQVEVFYEDVVVGYWDTVKFSGSIRPKAVSELVHRIDDLREAVKSAREAANNVEVVDKKIGAAVLEFIFDAS